MIFLLTMIAFAVSIALMSFGLLAGKRGLRFGCTGALNKQPACGHCTACLQKPHLKRKTTGCSLGVSS
jgi:hypothetical protein